MLRCVLCPNPGTPPACTPGPGRFQFACHYIATYLGDLVHGTTWHQLLCISALLVAIVSVLVACLSMSMMRTVQWHSTPLLMSAAATTCPWSPNVHLTRATFAISRNDGRHAALAAAAAAAAGAGECQVSLIDGQAGLLQL